MSIGLKGLITLQNKINNLQKQIDECCGDTPVSSDVSYCLFRACETESCSKNDVDFGDGGVTLSSISLQQDLWPEMEVCPETIKVTFEGTPEGFEEPITWCCCFWFKEVVEAPAGLQTPHIKSYDIIDNCEDVACEECYEGGPCEMTSSPGNVIKFTTSAAPDGEVDNITTTETYNDGWNGMEISIVRLSDNNVEATYTGPPAGSLSQNEPPLYLKPSTEYGIYINDAGAWPAENGIVIEQDGANLLTVNGFPGLVSSSTCEWFLEQGEGEGDGEGEPIFGCTDPNAINYNPEATIDDGSCQYEEEGEG
jgi:hypothetical protein